MKKNLTEVRREMSNSIVTAGDFSILVSMIEQLDRRLTSKQKT